MVTPRMFKHLVGQGHPEFSSGRQRDAAEYVCMQYLLEVYGVRVCVLCFVLLLLKTPAVCAQAVNMSFAGGLLW